MSAALLKKPMRRLGLQGRFMLSFGVIVVTLMAMVILFVEKRQAGIMLKENEMRGLAVARSIAAVGRPALLNYDHVSLQQAAEQATNDEGVLYVIVLNKENQVAGYSGHPELQGGRLIDPVSVRAVEVPKPTIQRIDEPSSFGLEEPCIDIAVPVRVESSPVRWGTVRVGLSLAELNRRLVETRLALLLIGAIAVALVLLSARLLSHRVTAPLERLALATTAVARGDLTQKVEENLLGELGDLARAFNKMTADLRASREAIEYQNQHLENMVELRTAALHEKAVQLQQAYEELKKLDQLKSDFLSNVSHELRTPLTSIRSFTEILIDQDDELAAPERLEFYEIIAGQAVRLTRLISDLLDLSKMEAGRFQCERRPERLDRLVAATVETLQSLAREKRLTVDVDVASDLPEVFADPDRLDQVLTNLLGNAIKFTPAGGHIRVTARKTPRRYEPLGAPQGVEGWTPEFTGMTSPEPESGEYVRIEVHDDGCGVPLEDQQKIFDKFGQVGNVLTDKPQGTGLGLAISAAIVVQHEGALWVESAPQHGAVFAFTLPVAAPREGSEAPAPVTTAAPAPRDEHRDLVQAVERTTQGGRILVVDDEPEIVLAVTELLEPLGYDVIGCDGGGQAIAKARELQPDAILLDIMMPEIDGYDVLRLLKSDPLTESIPVIVLSVLEDRQKAFDLGAVEYIRKPFEKSELIENVRTLV